MMEKLNLTLVMPALPSAGDFNVLRVLLGRGDRTPYDQRSVEALLLSLFGAQVADDKDVPVAAVTRLADTQEGGAGWCMRADPVYLSPDRQYLVMLGNDGLDISPDEARALTVELNEWVGEHGGRLEAPHPKRWYLHLPKAPRLRTAPLREVVGNHIDEYLPWGEEGRQWHVLLNELQMALHMSAVNRARERRGQLPVNSVWFWGGGEEPRLASTKWRGVFADDPFSVGLARLAGVDRRPLPTDLKTALAEAGAGEWLVVLNGGTTAEQLEQYWFKPLYQSLRRGAVAHVTLYTAEGTRCAATPISTWRIWRRRQKLVGI